MGLTVPEILEDSCVGRAKFLHQAMRKKSDSQRWAHGSWFPAIATVSLMGIDSFERSYRQLTR